MRKQTVALTMCGAVAFLVATSGAGEKKEHSAVKPVPRDAKWVQRHEAFVGIAKKGNVEVLFLGDSITDAWGGEGHGAKTAGTNVFKQEFEPMKAANFGIGGDRTQHVLWRLQNGEFDGIQPKVLMLMIGTNNSNGTDNSADEISDGIKAIVKEIHTRSPKTKILLLGIFPRANPKTGEPNPTQMDKIKQVNATISKLDDGGKTIQYLDIGSKFMQDGKIPKEIMPDQLHLSETGYKIWAEAVKEPIQKLLNAK
jgi:lysophospholipase L1-like esterase